MKNSRLMDIWSVLNELGNKENMRGKFVQFVSMNIGIIENNIKALKKSVEFSKEYKEYFGKLINLKIKYCQKDTNGNIIIVNGEPFITRNIEKFENEKSNLDKEYEKEIKIQEKKNEDYDKLMEEDVEIKFFKCKLSELGVKIDDPDNKSPITGRQLVILMELIEG